MHAVYFVVSALASVTGPAIAIVVFTMGVRLVLSPLSYLQAKGDRRRTALAPRVTELQRRHRDNPTRLATELSTLYKKEGVSPLGGIGLALLQMPFFFLMYRVATSTTVGNGQVFGVPLSAHFLDAPGAVFAMLFAVLAVLAWWSSRRLAGFLRLMPFGTLLAAAVVPLAAGLYLVTTTAWTAVEYAIWRRHRTSLLR